MGAGETLEWAKPVFSETNHEAQPVLPVGNRAKVVDALGLPARRSGELSGARRARPVGAPGPDLEQLAESLLRGSSPRGEGVADRSPDRRVEATGGAVTGVEIDGVEGIGKAAEDTAADDESPAWLRVSNGAAPSVRRPERDIADAPGIGDTMARRLRQAGIATVADLAAVGTDDLEELAQAVGTFRGRLEVWVLAARDTERSSNATGKADFE